MEIKTNKLSDVKVEIRGEMEWEEFKPYYDRALLVLGKEAPIKGFRPGKAPRDMVEKAIGQEKIMSKAAELVLQEQFDVTFKGAEPHGTENRSTRRCSSCSGER